MLGPEVGRQWELRRFVLLLVPGRPDPRIVRGGEIDMNEERAIARLLNQPNCGVGEIAADVGRQADAFFRKPLTGIGLKLPAAITCCRTATEIDVILSDRTAAAVEAVALVVSDL